MRKEEFPCNFNPFCTSNHHVPPHTMTIHDVGPRPVLGALKIHENSMVSDPMHSAKEDQPCLLLFNEFRKDEGSKIDKNRCKPELILAALARCGAIIALRCSVLALIALSTTTFGCYWDLLGDSGLVIDRGLVRLSVSPCNLRNLWKSWHRSASKTTDCMGRTSAKGSWIF